MYSSAPNPGGCGISPGANDPGVANDGLGPAGVLAVWAGLVLAGSMFVDLPDDQ